MPVGNCLAAAASCEISSRASAAEVAARPPLLLMKPARHGSPLFVGVLERTLASPIVQLARLSDRACCGCHQSVPGLCCCSCSCSCELKRRNALKGGSRNPVSMSPAGLLNTM